MGTLLLSATTNHIDGATLTGGAYESGKPRTNVQDPDLALIARCDTLDSGDSVIYGDCGAAVPWRMFAAIRTSSAGRASPPMGRFRLAATTFDGGSPTPLFDSTALPFSALTPALTYSVHWACVIGTKDNPISARYFEFSWSDEYNPTLANDIARLWGSDALDLPYNFAPGAGGSGFQVNSSVAKGRGGVKRTNRRTAGRTFRCAIPMVDRDFAFGDFEAWQADRDITEEVLLCVDPDDTTNKYSQWRFGTLRGLTEIEYPTPFERSIGIEHETQL